MLQHYTDERNVQIVISLLKAHGIKRVIASPGATNITFIGSIQQDSFFEIYSSVDERSAAYIACGMAAESGEPVVLSCTGATASRNYIPGLTEAFYRKLPVLAVTSSQHLGRCGNLSPQFVDRSILPNDIAKISVILNSIHTPEDEKTCIVNANKAILELSRHGGGPAHINLVTNYSRDFTVKELPLVRMIQRITENDKFPELPPGKKIAIYIGSHLPWKKELTDVVDRFCRHYNAVVFCEHGSNYHGEFRLLYSLVAAQECSINSDDCPDLVIHIGEISGDYYLAKMLYRSTLWRVSPDGEVRDLFGNLHIVFEMDELTFFQRYCIETQDNSSSYFQQCQIHLEQLRRKLPELPFSNAYVASVLASGIPPGSEIHLGILNSIRSWNFFEMPKGTECFSNTGGFGIDGCMSSLIGASLIHPNKLYFGIFGDLAFFYDMNSLGNRHIGKNIRILLVNNGKGTEFRNYNHPGAAFESNADDYIAAARHYGNKSPDLVRHYAQDLGFEYKSASNKTELEQVRDWFLSDLPSDHTKLLEIFTNSQDESEALYQIMHIEFNIFGIAKSFMKNTLSESSIDFLMKVKQKLK